MPISDEYGIIFIHIPKTGGTTIEYLFEIQGTVENLLSYDYIESPAYQHLTYDMLKQRVPAFKFDTYMKFAFVRNPWERLVSTFHWNNRGFASFEEFIYHIDSLFKKYTLETLFQQYPDCKKDYCSHLLPQHLFVGPDVRVYRFETFEHDVSELLKQFNITKDIPKANSTSHEHYSRYYNENTKEIVARIYQKDIEMFGYRFDCIS